jgi:hypothetical protein
MLALESAKLLEVPPTELKRLTPEQRAKFNAWGAQEVEALKAKGASEADFKEPALADLVLQRILTNHSEEIRADQDFAEALFLMLHDEASPQELRKLAAQERERGNLDMAYNIEVLADRRERTGASPFPFPFPEG